MKRIGSSLWQGAGSGWQRSEPVAAAPARRSPTLRRKLVAVHKWLGLWLAVYLGVQALAGAILVFDDEILQWLAADNATAEGMSERSAPEALSAAITVLEREYPHWNIGRVYFPAGPGLPFLARMNDAGGELWREVLKKRPPKRVAKTVISLIGGEETLLQEVLHIDRS